MTNTFFKSACAGAALIGLCLSANAATTAPAKSSWGASFTALYLQPGANNLTYAVHTKPLPVPAPNWYQDTVKPNHHFAFDLGLHYQFADQVDEIKADWLHFSSTDSDSVAKGSGVNSIAPPYYFGPLAQALLGTSASSTVKFNLDNANLVFAHQFTFGHYLQMQPFAGLSGAYLKEYIEDNYLGEDTGGDPYSITSYNTSKYTGIGPRIGVDMTGVMSKHFSIIGEFATSIFVGSMHSTTTFYSYGGGKTTPSATDMADQSKMTIVPELDTKLALAYDVDFKSGSSVTFQAGYMLRTYLDGIDQVVPTALVPGAFNGGVIAIETEGNVQSNFNLSGPFVKMSWSFA